MNKWSAYFIYHAYQLCIIALFQLISHFFKYLNFTDGDDEEGEKRLVGLRQAAPQAKTLLLRILNVIPCFIMYIDLKATYPI